MNIPKLKSENVQQLRKLVTEVPKEVRDLARMERRYIQQMDTAYPGSSSYVLSRGGLYNNTKLAQTVDNLNAKNAVEFYQRQPSAQKVSTEAIEVVKASHIMS